MLEGATWAGRVANPRERFDRFIHPHPVDLLHPLAVRITLVLVGVIVALTLLAGFEGKADLFFAEGHWVRRTLTRSFRLRGEATVPAWFSTGLLWTAASLLAGVAALRRAWGLGQAAPWIMLSILFFYLSADEALSWHELTGPAAERIVPREGVFLFGWVIFGMAFAAAVAVLAMPWLLRLPRRTAVLIFIGGAVFVGGALGCEMLGNWVRSDRSLPGWATLYELTQIVEETLEMLGVVLFMHAISTYLIALVDQRPAGEGRAASG